MPQKLSLLVTKILFLLLIWILPLCTNLAAQSSRAQGRREKVQKVLQGFQDVSKFPGAIAGVYFADGSSLAVASGYADRDAKILMSESDLLHAGSVGKTIRRTRFATHRRTSHISGRPNCPVLRIGVMVFSTS